MENVRDLDHLLSDLHVFLLVLDKEKLSLEAQVKKEGMAELLARLQNQPAEDAEYMTMNSISTSGLSRSQRNTGIVPAYPGGASKNSRANQHTQGMPAAQSRPAPQLPPLERAKQRPSSTPQEQEVDDSYEKTEPINPRGHSNTGSADTDSSHYESYGEEEECVKDRAHYIQWSQNSGMSDSQTQPKSQICGFLWRKKWLGQWTKQLFIIREHLLLCYKCARDLNPILQLNLCGCRVAYKPKRSKKMQHELKIYGISETLVMGFQSRQQAEEWRKVIEEVSSSTVRGPSVNNSPPTPGQDQSWRSPQPGTDRNRPSPQTGTDLSNHSPNSCTDRDLHLPQPGTEHINHSPQLGTDRSRNLPQSATDCTRHSPHSGIDRSRDSPKCGANRSKQSTVGKSVARCTNVDQSHGCVGPLEPGLLNVLLSCQWQNFWCTVENCILQMFNDSSCKGAPSHSVILAGCEVSPSRNQDIGQLYGVGISKHGKDVAILKMSSEEERDLWLKLLQAGRGHADPAAEAHSLYEGANVDLSCSSDLTSPASVGALLLRKFPIPNTYVDDPFIPIPSSVQPDSVYFNAEISQHVQIFNGVSQQGPSESLHSHSPLPLDLQTNNGTILAFERSHAPKSSFGKSHSDYQMRSHTPPLREKSFFGSHQTLAVAETRRVFEEIVLPIDERSITRPQERACWIRTQLKAGSEMNLLSIGRSCTQASSDYASMTARSAASECVHPRTVLKRAASARGPLKHPPSVVVIEKGKVLQKRKEWEMKASA